MEEASGAIYTDVSRLKAFTNPVRAAIYYHLATLTEATATHIAKNLSISPSLASYHLRELAKYSFVESFTPSSADRRSHWWRILDRGVTLPAPTNTPGNARDLVSQVESIVLNNHLYQLSQFFQTRQLWSPDWVESAFSADFILRLPPDELRALYVALEAVVRSFEARHVGREGSADEEATMVLLHGFPINARKD